MGKKTAKKKSTEIDEHDLPTEPVPFFVPPPQMNTIPAPPPQQQIVLGPFPQSPPNPVPPIYPVPPNAGYPAYPVPPNVPQSDAYPYRAPLAPQQPDKGPQQPSNVNKSLAPARQSPFYLSLIPLCIGLFFVCIQMLLLARFVLKLVGIANGALWVDTIYALCDIALLPFQAFLPPLQLPALISARLEPYTLLAVIVYGILSRFIVHLAKIVLRTRKPGVLQSAK